MNDHTPGAIEVLRRATEAYNAGDVDGGMAFIAPGAVDHSTFGGNVPGFGGIVLGPEGWRQRWEQVRAAIPDLTVTVEHTVAAGDTVARVISSRGTRNGRAFEASGVDMVRVRDGRIVEHWAVAELPE